MSYSRLRLGALFLPAAATALIAGGYATARPADRNPALQITEQSLFLGMWELDLTRMPETYGPPPKRVTFTFEDIGSGTWRTKVEITAPDDSVRRATIEYRRDGRAVQGEGDNIDGDTAAFNSPAANVLVMNMAKNKSPAGVRVYTISADGKEMTEAAAGIDGQGAPFIRNFYFKRIR